MGACGSSQGGGPGGVAPRWVWWGTPDLGILPFGAFVCDGAITGWVGHG